MHMVHQSSTILAVEDTLLLAFGPRTGALVDELQAAFAELGP